MVDIEQSVHHKETAHAPPPKVGDEIYVETRMYLSHGVDDVLGGLATVTKVSTSFLGVAMPSVFICVDEHPGHHYNWEMLAPKQKELKERFGSNRACEDPDERPEFNRW